MTFPLSNVTWRPSYRVIPSRFPPIDLFEGVNSNADDCDLLNELEGETSARLREEAGAIHLVRDDDRRYGPGWTPVMAAFCHFPATGSRFSDGTFGAYYCALTEATAIAETVYHAEHFMGESDEPPMMLQQRVYLSDLTGQLIDLRGQNAAHALLDPDSWAAGQTLGRKAWEEQTDGIVYPSVRDPEGEWAAVLRPPVLSATRQGRHLGYDWDGQHIRHVYELTLLG
ncbi:MAG: RES family NAD+ phosphorylase [Gammaproteobacteria bacterium]|uniref:RES domain-containing protein n=1 Tax=Vreelandella titanicae TaxID=664683 RepID=A0A558JDK9_9GAMM|nr:RES family NAD+ phosphorylase [Halomonas titanicae]MBR9905466.1 RES family NAD+ phosphorylase [Gammaproteobacteria bacterium]TVU91705.1 RES domain-containing protein [Halomonas titanicae]